jgi:integrase
MVTKATTKKRPGWGTQSIGQKRPFTPTQVQLIRHTLTEHAKSVAHPRIASDSIMYLALLETALSTCLRSVDLLALRAGDVAGGSFPLKQRKTGRVMMVRLNRRSQEALAAWVGRANLGPNDKLFNFDRQTYGEIVKDWAVLVRADPKHYSTHSMRRTTPAHIYKQTGNVKAAAELLGHANIGNTGVYLGIGTEEAHKLAEEHEI